MVLGWQRQTGWNLLRALGTDFDGSFHPELMPLRESQLCKVLAAEADVPDDG